MEVGVGQLVLIRMGKGVEKKGALPEAVGVSSHFSVSRCVLRRRRRS